MESCVGAEVSLGKKPQIDPSHRESTAHRFSVSMNKWIHIQMYC